MSLMDGENAISTFSKYSDISERYYLFYSWNKDLSDDAYSSTITEYKVVGPAYDEKSYEEMDKCIVSTGNGFRFCRLRSRKIRKSGAGRG